MLMYAPLHSPLGMIGFLRKAPNRVTVINSVCVICKKRKGLKNLSVYTGDGLDFLTATD